MVRLLACSRHALFPARACRKCVTTHCTPAGEQFLAMMDDAEERAAREAEAAEPSQDREGSSPPSSQLQSSDSSERGLDAGSGTGAEVQTATSGPVVRVAPPRPLVHDKALYAAERKAFMSSKPRLGDARGQAQPGAKAKDAPVKAVEGSVSKADFMLMQREVFSLGGLGPREHLSEGAQTQEQTMACSVTRHSPCCLVWTLRQQGVLRSACRRGIVPFAGLQRDEIPIGCIPRGAVLGCCAWFLHPGFGPLYPRGGKGGTRCSELGKGRRPQPRLRDLLTRGPLVSGKFFARPPQPVPPVH